MLAVWLHQSKISLSITPLGRVFQTLLEAFIAPEANGNKE
jgi:hypothetical protein